MEPESASLKANQNDYTSCFRPAGLQHFYASFALDTNVCLRDDALAQFQLEATELTSDLRLTPEAVARKRWGNHHEQPTDQFACEVNRNRVPEGVIYLAPEEVEKDSSGDETDHSTTSSDDSSSGQDTSTVDNTRSPLADDIEQYDLMKTAYLQVSQKYEVHQDRLIGGIEKLQAFEGVPRRWPLARLTFPLRKTIEYLDRLLAGCCWEVLISRPAPQESLASLRQASKTLTLLLAGYLAEEVATILREVTTHPTQKLHDEETVHLLCANYWILPIYQEMLHTTTRYNATSQGKRKRPCSGLAKIVAHPKPPKTKNQTAQTARVSDWIGGLCPFPAHCMPYVPQRLQGREDDYRHTYPQWYDQRTDDEDTMAKQKEAQMCRNMQFRLKPYQH